MIGFLNRSLMARLVAHFLLLSVVLVALVGSLAYFRARVALQKSVAERLGMLAALEEQQLRRWVDERRRDVVFLASLPEVLELSRSVLDPTLHTGEIASRLRDLLSGAVEAKPYFREVLVLSAGGGKIVLSTDASREGEYRVRESFFTRGLSETFVRSVYPSHEALVPTLTVSTPLASPSGETLGVLAVHLDLEELNRILRIRAGLGASGEAYLVDRLNAFVSGTQFGRERFPRGVRSAGIDAAVGGEDGSGLYRNYEGKAVIGVYRWIDDLELALLVEIGRGEALAPARRIVGLIFGYGLLLALALTAGTLFLARQITRPVVRMTEAALAVSEGDLSANAPVTTNDEIGVLGRTFNEMTRKLSTSYENLRDEIAERRRTQEELETKNAELERFTYTVSHDLKSPLVTILGFLGFLERDVSAGDRERVRADIDQIRGAAHTMSRLLNELLELSRVGRLVHPPEEVALGELAEEARELLSGEISAHGVDVAIAPDLPVVRGDRVRLLEVFQNLIENAVKFRGDAAAPSVDIGTRMEGGERIVYVRDNGSGIVPRYHEKVFGLFERLDGTVEGTGVGLALVKRIVEIHGGRVWVESEGADLGSTFCFTLPQE